jgi:hypothetical protein
MIICATAQQIKYIMNKIVFFVLSLVLISCEKKDRIEIDNIDGYKVEKKFKNDENSSFFNAS